MHTGITIYFVRHGQTDWNAAARYQGQIDIPLNETGRGQARRNGETLRRLLRDPSAFDFVASPLSRARETMQIMRRELGLPIDDFRCDDLLKEVHYGHWEGKLASDLTVEDPQEIARRNLDPFRWRPVGGESYSDLMARSDTWLANVTRDTIVASHGGVSRTVRGRVLDLPPLDMMALPVPQDLVLVLRPGQVSWL
jgi:broad specificity phosphatase PhoE